jgi:hypothetical protein
VVVGTLQRGATDVTWLSHNARDFVHVAYGLVVRGLSRKVEVIADSNASIDAVIASWVNGTTVLPSFTDSKHALRMEKLQHEFRLRITRYVWAHRWPAVRQYRRVLFLGFLRAPFFCLRLLEPRSKCITILLLDVRVPLTTQPTCRDAQVQKSDYRFRY